MKMQRGNRHQLVFHKRLAAHAPVACGAFNEADRDFAIQEQPHKLARVAAMQREVDRWIPNPTLSRPIPSPASKDYPHTRIYKDASSRSILAVSSFRFRARLDGAIPLAFSGQRGYYPRF